MDIFCNKKICYNQLVFVLNKGDKTWETILFGGDRTLFEELCFISLIELLKGI